MGREERKLLKHLSRHETYKERAQRANKSVQTKNAPRVQFRGDAGDWDEWDHPQSKRTKSVNNPRLKQPVEGWVLVTSSGLCRVRVGAEDLELRGIPGVAPGDRVICDGGAIRSIQPRRSVLSRPDPGNPHQERVLAANIDAVVNVVSMASPPLRLGLIDRYLIAIRRGGAEPLICVNKIDLGGEDRQLDAYRALGIPVVLCSAQSGQGLDELAAHLADRLCVFTGHSGVGKSSLLNALCPELHVRTADVGWRGRHTTTSSCVYTLANGARIIDTPGIRELGLWDVEPDEIRDYFPELAALACRFRDCRHTDEPGCRLKEALAGGSMAKHRYEAYLRILSGQ